MMMMVQGSSGSVGLHVPGDVDLPDDVDHVVSGRAEPLSLSTQ